MGIIFNYFLAQQNRTHSVVEYALFGGVLAVFGGNPSVVTLLCVNRAVLIACNNVVHAVRAVPVTGRVEYWESFSLVA